MGNSYANITLMGAAPGAAAEALCRMGREAYVIECSNGVVIFDRECDDDMGADSLAALGTRLAEDLQVAAFVVMDIDDDILWFQLYRGRHLVAEYVNRSGNTTGIRALCSAVGRPGRFLQVWLLLRIPLFTQVWRHAMLASCLGLPDVAVGMGFRYLKGGELLEGVRFDQVCHVRAGSKHRYVAPEPDDCARSTWTCFTPCHASPNQTLQDARTRVFRSGDYAKRWDCSNPRLSMRRIGASWKRCADGSNAASLLFLPVNVLISVIVTVEESLDILFRQLPALALGRCRPRTIGEAIAQAGTTGTRSILDVDHVAARPEARAAVALSEDEIHQYFGGARPTREMMDDRRIAQIARRLDRWDAVFFHLCQGEEEQECVFIGRSGI